MSEKGTWPVLSAALLVGILLIATVGVGLSTEAKLVKVRDECERVSFNSLFGDGICLKDGKVTVGAFLDYVTKHQRHPLWAFDPQSFDLPPGKQVFLQNTGGEFHTWTKVAEFGGGFVPELNFGQEPRPECFEEPGINNLGLEAGETEAGAIAGSSDLPAGEYKFMCCVHPWMRSVVRVN